MPLYVTTGSSLSRLHTLCRFLSLSLSHTHTHTHTHTQLIHPGGGLSATVFWIIITWQSLSLWVVSMHDLCEGKVWAPSDKGYIICSEWMNTMAALCPFSGPGHGHKDDGWGGHHVNAREDGFPVMSQCYCPCQGYKKGACQKLWCMHWGEYHIQYRGRWMHGSWNKHAAPSITWCFYKNCPYPGINTLMRAMKSSMHAELPQVHRSWDGSSLNVYLSPKTHKNSCVCHPKVNF